MKKVDGKAIAQKVIDRLKKQPVPQKKLVAVLVGENEASRNFIKIKSRMAKELGVDFDLVTLAIEASQSEVEALVEKTSSDIAVGGLIVQLPLPSKFNREKILSKIDANKDVDALRSDAQILSPVVGVVTEILEEERWGINNKTVAVVGRGFLVGGPVSRWLEEEKTKGQNLQIKIADIDTENLEKFLQDADLVISGVGKKDLVRASWLKEGAAVIDFGFPPDLEQPTEASEANSLKRLSFYTPTPGGTGPILVAKLFENFYNLELQNSLEQRLR